MTLTTEMNTLQILDILKNDPFTHLLIYSFTHFTLAHFSNLLIVNLNLEKICLPRVGFEPTRAFAHWILSPTP